MPTASDSEVTRELAGGCRAQFEHLGDEEAHVGGLVGHLGHVRPASLPAGEVGGERDHVAGRGDLLEHRHVRRSGGGDAVGEDQQGEPTGRYGVGVGRRVVGRRLGGVEDDGGELPVVLRGDLLLGVAIGLSRTVDEGDVAPTDAERRRCRGRRPGPEGRRGRRPCRRGRGGGRGARGGARRDDCGRHGKEERERTSSGACRVEHERQHTCRGSATPWGCPGQPGSVVPSSLASAW